VGKCRWCLKMLNRRGWHWQLVASVAQQQEAGRKIVMCANGRSVSMLSAVVGPAFNGKPPGLRPLATSCQCHTAPSQSGSLSGSKSIAIPIPIAIWISLISQIKKSGYTQSSSWGMPHLNRNRNRYRGVSSQTEAQNCTESISIPISISISIQMAPTWALSITANILINR
jgi:hypothetical protein